MDNVPIESLVPAIIVVTGVFKRAGVPTKILPFLNLILGLVGYIALGTGPIIGRILNGLIYGAGAGGAYDAGKAGAQTIWPTSYE